MATAAITEDYTGERLDRVENFHGNQIVYVGWDKHLMFCAPLALMMPADTPFGAIVKDMLPGTYAVHPDFEKIDWNNVEWRLNGERFTPDFDASVGEQGIDHKSAIRFRTPELTGINGSSS